MVKEKVKHLSGEFASVFAHAGHISKEDPTEISNLTWTRMHMIGHPTLLKALCRTKAQRQIRTKNSFLQVHKDAII